MERIENLLSNPAHRIYSLWPNPSSFYQPATEIEAVSKLTFSPKSYASFLHWIVRRSSQSSPICELLCASYWSNLGEFFFNFLGYFMLFWVRIQSPKISLFSSHLQPSLGRLCWDSDDFSGDPPPQDHPCLILTLILYKCWARFQLLFDLRAARVWDFTPSI